MTAYLLDVNVLIALAWPEHRQHSLVRAWFGKNRAKGWATCPLVQAGFVRILSNPAFSSHSVAIPEAVEALRVSLGDDAHQFWPDSISFPDAVGLLRGRISGHQQVTDAYLVALAIRHRGKLATLDRRIVQLSPAGSVKLIS
ncbi:MAG: TA system VapC family ribonuclease toxin [Candidatus Sulfotelmatobacter sp.]